MADRQTALAVFDFLDSLRAGQYRIGADAEKDHATAGLLASLSGDTGLRDAVCAKLISPGMERARFLMVAEHDRSHRDWNEIDAARSDKAAYSLDFQVDTR